MWVEAEPPQLTFFQNSDHTLSLVTHPSLVLVQVSYWLNMHHSPTSTGATVVLSLPVAEYLTAYLTSLEDKR